MLARRALLALIAAAAASVPLASRAAQGDAPAGSTHDPGTPAAGAASPRSASAAVDSMPGVARLSISSDAACTLSVDGIARGMLEPAATLALTLPPGESAIECASVSTADAKVRVVQTLAPGTESAVALPLGDAIVERSCANRTSALVDLGGGLLRHCATKADWTQTDNGADLDWHAAKAFCAGRGSGWQLPTADEYTQLVDRSGRSTTSCGKHTCYMSPRFTLSSAVFWAAEEPAPGNAMMMTMIYGNRHPARQTISGGYRALCVRHRETYRIQGGVVDSVKATDGLSLNIAWP